jgi:hypothetical protein
MDQELNQRGHLPADEHIQVHCLWVAEGYPPSKVGGLIAGLRGLGLDQARTGTQRGGVVEWLIKSRGTGFAGAWLNIGYFTRPRTRLFGVDRVLTELPPVVEFASGSLYALSPSLTGLVVRFVLNETVGPEIDGALNRDYRTEISSAGSSAIVYDGPEQQRHRAVDDCFRRARDECAAWIDKRLPGFFAATGREHPTCMFLTTQALSPFAEANRLDWGTYGSVLGLDRDHEAWNLQAYPGLSLHVPERDVADRHWLIAGRRGAFFNDEMQSAYGGTSGRSWSNRLQHGVDELVAVLGVRTILRDFHAAAAETRDAASATSNGSGGRRKTLASLPEAVSALTEDIEPIAAELAAEPDVRRLVRDLDAVVPGPGNIYRLVTAPWPTKDNSPRPQPSMLAWVKAILDRLRSASPSVEREKAAQQPIPGLGSVIGDEIHSSADRLLKGATRTRDALATTATISSALETLRLDRRLFRLTIILGAIAVLAALPAIAQIAGVVLRTMGIEPPDLGQSPGPGT